MMMNTSVENIRSLIGDDDTELRESFQQFGWRKEFPAYVDENDVCIVGHRRLALAQQLDIEPVIVKLKLGTGEAADVERLKLAIVSNIGFKPMTKQDRQRIAEHLYGEKNWTMAAIGKALGVGGTTIRRDLVDFAAAAKSTPAKTASNPRGAGRPKGSSKTRSERAPKAVAREEKVAALADAGMSTNEISTLVGLGKRAVHQALEHVVIARDAVAKAIPDIDPSTLSLSAQQKLTAALRQHQRKLDAEFAQRVDERIRELVKDTVLPHYHEQYELYTRVNKARNGVMNRENYRLIWSCLHSDSRLSVSEERLSKAFHLWTDVELLLLNEKERPTNAVPLPKSYEELLARKRAVQEARRAKRSGGRHERHPD